MVTINTEDLVIKINARNTWEKHATKTADYCVIAYLTLALLVARNKYKEEDNEIFYEEFDKLYRGFNDANSKK